MTSTRKNNKESKRYIKIQQKIYKKGDNCDFSNAIMLSVRKHWGQAQFNSKS